MFFCRSFSNVLFFEHSGPSLEQVQRSLYIPWQNISKTTETRAPENAYFKECANLWFFLAF